MKRWQHICLGLTFIGISAASSTRAQDQNEKFYRDHPINVTVGNTAGGGYDLVARLLSKYMGHYIPGNPTMIVQNMPGAATLKEANYIYAVAPKDGSVIGTVARGAVVQPLFTAEQFDGSKFEWLGSVSKTVSTCIAYKTSTIKSWNDVMNHEFIVAGQGVSADSDVFALALKNIFGAKIKLVTGFPGTNDMSLAMERGEVDGFCGLSYSTLRVRHGDWLKNKSVTILLQAGLEREEELHNIPFIEDLAKDQDTLQTIRVITSPQKIALPFAAPPQTIPARVALLRQAFDATMKDKEFRSEADKLGVDVDPINGQEVDHIVRQLYNTPKNIILRAAHAMEDGDKTHDK
jgi:tripartite-type tricarboxylate transporter receptor subunit TctC